MARGMITMCLLFASAAAMQLTTPQFVAKHDANTTHKISAEAQEACENACGSEADVTCYTDCEVEVYQCYDVHIGNGKADEEEVFQKCKDEVLVKYQGFVALWEAKAMVALHRTNASGHGLAKDKCEGVCGADSICVTACEVGMYECFDTNTPKSEDAIKKCQEGIVEKVKKTYAASFVNHHMLLVRHNSGDWQAHVVKAEMRHHINDKCNDVCGIDAQCVSSCEVEMYTCFDVNTPTSEDKIKQCQEDALKAHEKAREASLLAIQPKSFLAPSSI